MDAGGVGHGLIQEQLIHCITSIIVLFYVPPAALNLQQSMNAVSGRCGASTCFTSAFNNRTSRCMTLFLVGLSSRVMLET